MLQRWTTTPSYGNGNQRQSILVKLPIIKRSGPEQVCPHDSGSAAPISLQRSSKKRLSFLHQSRRWPDGKGQCRQSRR